MSRFLQFWRKLNTRRIVKTCLFVFCVINMGIPSMLYFPSFPTIYYRFLWCFCMFPLVFLWLPRVFLLFPISVSSISYFRFRECLCSNSLSNYFSLKIAKIRRSQWQQQVHSLLRSRLLLVAITSTKETSWIKTGNGETVKVELETSQSSKKVDPHACVIRAKEEYFKGSKTVRHIPREISDNVYYFIKTEGGSVYWAVISAKFGLSTVSVVHELIYIFVSLWETKHNIDF